MNIFFYFPSRVLILISNDREKFKLFNIVLDEEMDEKKRKTGIFSRIINRI